MNFLFVEAITLFESGRRARGRFRSPQEFALPRSLVAEAIGQLAGWVAMERSSFKSRPIAALIGECVLAHSAGRDAVIDLEVELERCDEDAISYSGVATMDSIRLMSLGGCDAPMLPLDQFDDPASMQRQLEMLLSGGGVLAAFDPELTDAIPLEAFAHIQGGMQSEIVAPPAGPFYADHFPRRAVLPATLLLDAAIRLTRRVAELTNYAAIPLDAPISVRDVKLRAFIDPGDRLQLAVVQVPSESPAMDFAMTAVRDERRVATARISMAGS